MKKIFFLFSFLFLLGTGNLFAQQWWEQVGSDIDGAAAGDQFNSRHSVSSSADGKRVAIGASLNDGNGTDAGHVRIYSESGGVWSQLGSDINGEAAGDNSGHAVSLSGDGTRLAIGAPYNDGSGVDAGHVRVYAESGGVWSQVGGDIEGEAPDDRFGLDVSISDDGLRVAIGAWLNDGNGNAAGHVRVFSESGGTWTQVGGDIDGEAAEDRSGRDVSLSSDGKIVAIGAYANDGNGSGAGHVRVYLESGGTWSQLGSDIDAEVEGDNSGWDVSLSDDGKKVAIGAHNNDGNGTASGHVRVYSESGGSWTQVGIDIDGEAEGDFSGWSVSISGDGTTLAIGASSNDANGTASGHVRVYSESGGSWTKVGNDIDGEAAYDQSGYALSISADGTRVAVGAPYNDGSGNNAGHVRVYDVTLCDGDMDGDGACDHLDNCPDANPDQADVDHDGLGDTCDACPNDPDNDADGDGICGEVDNCPISANADQSDVDNDGIGDACDACPVETNYALSFNEGNWVEIPDHPSLRPCTTCPFTVELWVYRATNYGQQHILGKRTGCNDPSDYYQMIDGYLGFGNGTLGGAQTNIYLPLYQWHHLAGVFDGAQFRFYYDGALVATGSGTIGDGTGTSLILGGSGTCYAKFFGGKMDNVRIWNVARTQAEIQAGMFACPDGNEPGLAAAWNFDEGSGNIARDLTANHNNGTLVNSPAWVLSTLPCCVETPVVVDAGTCTAVFRGYAPAECTTLTANAFGGTYPYTYLWSNGSTTESISVCPLETTIYSVTVTDTYGATGTDAVTVEVVDIRCGSGKVKICHSTKTMCVKTNLVPNHLNHGDYLGPCGTSPCSGVQNLVMPGSNGGIAEWAEQQEIDAYGIAIYPNPAGYEVTFHLHGLENEAADLTLFDYSGKVVWESTIEQGLSELRLDLSGYDFANGVYIVKAGSAGKLLTGRLVIFR